MTGAGSRDPEILLDERALAERVERLAAEITADHPEGVLLIGVLKGALIFLADLVRQLQRVDVSIDFLAISRYAPDSGRVRILKDLDLDVTGRDVILVEDLVDTGLTLAYLVQHVVARGARTADVCTMLDRAERRIVPLPLRYVGEELTGDVFVVGYGLHHRERYRNLPVVVRADPDALAADPDVYLGLYKARDNGVSKKRDARVTFRRATP